MCCIDSTLLQVGHSCLSFFEVLYSVLPFFSDHEGFVDRFIQEFNCCTLGRMTCLLRLFHIVAVVSLVPLDPSIARFAAWMYSVASGRGGLCRFSRMPLYTVFWSIVCSFTPCRLNSGGICRSSTSYSSFSAPSSASLLLSSFPNVPLWALTQLKAAFLNRAAFSIPIRPMSSQVRKFVVSPFITYFEFDAISKYESGGFPAALLWRRLVPLFGWIAVHLGL
jgi:hypothetical protein